MDDLKARVNQLVHEKQSQSKVEEFNKENQKEYCKKALETENLPVFDENLNSITYKDIEKLRKLKAFVSRLVSLIDDSAWIRPCLDLDPNKITAREWPRNFDTYTELSFGIPQFYYRRRSQYNGLDRVELASTQEFDFIKKKFPGKVKLTGLFQPQKKEYIKDAKKSLEIFKQQAIAPYDHVTIESLDGDHYWTACIFRDGTLVADFLRSPLCSKSYFLSVLDVSEEEQENILVWLAAELITNKGQIQYRDYGVTTTMVSIFRERH